MQKTLLLISTTLLYLFLFNGVSFANNNLPRLFLFLGGDNAESHKKILKNSCINGVQIIYSWQQLEPKKDIYDFSKIENDLKFLNNIHKKLFIQVQDRSFDPTIFNVPDYIRFDDEYHSGVAMQYDFPGEGKSITSGWVARVWDPSVQERFQLLIKKLASRFDGKIYGINLPETAVDFDINHLPKDFTFDNYFYAELNNMIALRKAFNKSIVLQYVNFIPGEWNNDHHYMSRLFYYAAQYHIGVGGPDVVPYRLSQMQNSYDFFHQYNNKRLLIGMAIQEPDYLYKNPSTNNNYQFSDFYNFTKDYLAASILFWNIQEPFFSEQLAPKLTAQYFQCRE